MSDWEHDFEDRLVLLGRLVRTGDRGLWGVSAEHENLILAVREVARARLRLEPSNVIVTPPVIPEELNSRSGYAETFPHFVAKVATLRQREAGRGYAIAGAGCHFALSTLSGRTLARPGYFGARSTCFRDEHDESIFRLRCFRQDEAIVVDGAEGVHACAQHWQDLLLNLLSDLGLKVLARPATDSFTGRLASLLSEMQLTRRAKTEIIWVSPGGTDVALASVNEHATVFAEKFDFTVAGCAQTESACVGIGLERVALALIASHGFSVEKWPQASRNVLFQGRC